MTTREWQLWTALSGYGDTVAEAAEKNEPFLMTRRLLGIAQSFNSLYNTQRILSEDNRERENYWPCVSHRCSAQTRPASPGHWSPR